MSLVSGPSEGVFVKPQPPCAGLELGLEAPSLVTTVVADGAGSVTLTPEVSEQVCGQFLQAVELALCRASGVAEIP